MNKPRVQRKANAARGAVADASRPLHPDIARLVEALAKDMAWVDHARDSPATGGRKLRNG